MNWLLTREKTLMGLSTPAARVTSRGSREKASSPLSL